MVRVNAAIKSQGFTWDFAVDGGAVGVYTSPITIPAGAIVCIQLMNMLATVTGGAGAVINLGWPGVNIVNNAPMPQAIGICGYQIASSFLTSPGTPLLFEIAVNTITAGKIRFVTSYYEIS